MGSRGCPYISGWKSYAHKAPAFLDELDETYSYVVPLLPVSYTVDPGSPDTCPNAHHLRRSVILHLNDSRLTNMAYGMILPQPRGPVLSLRQALAVAVVCLKISAVEATVVAGSGHSICQLREVLTPGLSNYLAFHVAFCSVLPSS